MSIQFLVDVQQQNFRNKLVLPDVFTQILYTGSPWVYVIHNRGTKHKVCLKKVSGTKNYALYSREWKAFVNDSQYMRVRTFHFIRAAPDEYYVTAYHNDGSECNGYDVPRFGFRQRRCLVTVNDLENSPIIPAALFGDPLINRLRVLVSDALVSTVTHRLVVRPKDGDGYVLFGQGWHVLVHVERIELGQRLVFTNVLNDSVKMIPFADTGLGLRFEQVPRMPLNVRVPFMRSPIDKDPRMQHECDWDGHEEFHHDERYCFYSPMCAYVTERSRLTIPAWFVDDHKLQKFHNAYVEYDEDLFYVDLEFVFHAENTTRTNHMTLNAPWRNVVARCGFVANKMARFKMIQTVRDPFETVDPLQPVMIPLFHMC